MFHKKHSEKALYEWLGKLCNVRTYKEGNVRCFSVDQENEDEDDQVIDEELDLEFRLCRHAKQYGKVNSALRIAEVMHDLSADYDTILSFVERNKCFRPLRQLDEALKPGYYDAFVVVNSVALERRMDQILLQQSTRQDCAGKRRRR